MDRPRQNDHLGVNKIGKNIRKSPLHQPNFAVNANNAAGTRPQAQPQVYNISKNDFRSIVQQLTGSPSRESLPRSPQNNPPKPQNTRLQRIRPAPLTQINRPLVPLPAVAPRQPHPHLVRPPPPEPPLPQGTQQPMMGHGNQFWSNTAESPVSEYMRYLQSSLGDSIPNGNQMQPGHEQPPYMPAHEQQQYMPAHEQRPHMPAQPQPQPQPNMMPGLQPRMNVQGPLQPNQYLPPPGLIPSPVPQKLPSPQFNGPVPVTPTLPSPRFNQMFGSFPSPRYNGFGPIHSPTSQFLLPSPTGYPNMFSPRSPYPLLSPGVQYPQPLTPNFSFSQIAQSGILGPGQGPGHPQPPPTSPTGYQNMFSPRSPYPLLSPGVQYPQPLTPKISFSQIAKSGSLGAGPGPGHSQPPPSPGLMFPLSPSGFFPIPSPRWGEY